jgi:hypothetical protein
MSDDEAQKLWEEAVRKQRGYADLFDWPDKLDKEYGIAVEFIAALDREGGPRIIGVKQHGPGEDPPDCEMITEAGEAWGVEITELVNKKAIEKTRLGQCVYAVWSDAALISDLRGMISRKDDPAKVMGGPYDRYILLIHTDEDDLPADRLQNVVRNQSFVTRLIDDLYVLASYDTKVGHAPLLHFTMTKRA